MCATVKPNGSAHRLTHSSGMPLSRRLLSAVGFNVRRLFWSAVKDRNQLLQKTIDTPFTPFSHRLHTSP